MSSCQSQERKRVGIIDFSIYVPKLYVSQNSLEQWDNVSQGKYTIGLGQEEMAVCSDREDVVSMCLTVTERLINHSQIEFGQIGRLDVGSESLIDRSKSIKSMIMQLFKDSGNLDVEGADNVNACYGGTAALFNCIDWIESSAWDGRYGLVVMADIAVYKDKAARPTGGAGAIALLIGENAPIQVENALRSTYSDHQYDFYKPHISSSYPVVDGKLSIHCYLNSILSCYDTYRRKCNRVGSVNPNDDNSKSLLPLDSFDRIVFHSPFCGLVRKAFCLLRCADCIRSSTDKKMHISEQVSYNSDALLTFDTNKEMQKTLSAYFASEFKHQTEPSLLLAKALGNSYTSSVYMCLVSALSSLQTTDKSSDQRILLFSYGSGLISSLFSLVIKEGHIERLRTRAQELMNYISKDSRMEISPSQMERIYSYQQTSCYIEKKDWYPTFPIEALPPSMHYLDLIDKKLRRFYKHRMTSTVGDSPDQAIAKASRVDMWIEQLNKCTDDAE